jgi:hypothetical protein
MSNTILRLSKEVSAGQADHTSFVPPSGKKTIIGLFQGEAPGSNTAVVKLVWKFDTAEETILWSIKGSGQTSIPIELPISEVNGTNALAVVLENSGLTAVYLSGQALVEVDE